MSAIWGCVDLGGGNLPEGLCAAMERPLHEYKIDRYASISGGNVVMGCGVQYIKTWSEKEPLPIYDAEADVYFTADCLIDNRAELIAGLCPGNSDVPDGELLFLAYKKWGGEMPKHVYGAYSYAVYERKENRLTVGADHVFSRSIYYMRAGDRVFFSTVIESIFDGAGGRPEINEEWITMFLSINSLAVLSNPVDTPYKGVSRVKASHYVVFDSGGERPVEYWSYKNVKKLRLGSDEEYRERFRSLMEQLSRETLQGSMGEVGILLSSGLDSSSIAAFMEPILSQEGRRLHSYTYVPIETYKSTYNEKYVISNERKGVEMICEMYPGIVPKFLSVPEQNAVSSIKRILPVLEVPYKSHNNLAWIDEFARIAADDGCKILLTGQSGNATISAGNIFTYIMSRIMHGRLIDAALTANRFAKRHGFGRKWVARRVLNDLTPGFMRRRDIADYWGNSYINRDFARAIGIRDKDSRTEQNAGFMKPLTYETERSLIFNPTAFAQVGEDETKLYLKYGMVTRDITRDIRMFEFCLAVPMYCLVGPDAGTRRLVRYYLSDKLPAALTDENAPRGRQSGDTLDRMFPYWDELYSELARGCAQPRLQKIIDRDMVAASLDKFRDAQELRDGKGDEKEKEFVRLCAVYIIGAFLEEEENRRQKG